MVSHHTIFEQGNPEVNFSRPPHNPSSPAVPHPPMLQQTIGLSRSLPAPHKGIVWGSKSTHSQLAIRNIAQLAAQITHRPSLTVDTKQAFKVP